MKIKHYLLLMLLSFCKLQAQQDTTASGGDATGSGGSVNYSIGQVAYVTQTRSNGSASQGVQQPFEFFTLSGENFTAITLKVTAYPNPTISDITISVPDYNVRKLTYQLYDIHGKSIGEGKITDAETVLDMQSYPASVYLLQVFTNNKEIKTFKIIKN